MNPTTPYGLSNSVREHGAFRPPSRACYFSVGVNFSTLFLTGGSVLSMGWTMMSQNDTNNIEEEEHTTSRYCSVWIARLVDSAARRLFAIKSSGRDH